jgi:hypothetical protein
MISFLSTGLGCFLVVSSVMRCSGCNLHSLVEGTLVLWPTWYASSLPAEVCCLHPLEELQRIISRTLDLLYSETDSPSGLLVDVDYLLVIKTFERQIQTWYEQVADADSK